MRFLFTCNQKLTKVSLDLHVWQAKKIIEKLKQKNPMSSRKSVKAVRSESRLQSGGWTGRGSVLGRICGTGVFWVWSGREWESWMMRVVMNEQMGRGDRMRRVWKQWLVWGWRNEALKSGFHYPSWRPELTARVDGWPVSITRQHGPCWRVMETGHPSTRAVNSGSGNWALIQDKPVEPVPETIGATQTRIYEYIDWQKTEEQYDWVYLCVCITLLHRDLNMKNYVKQLHTWCLHNHNWQVCMHKLTSLKSVKTW